MSYDSNTNPRYSTPIAWTLTTPALEWPGAEFLCSCNTEALRVCRTEDGDVELAVWSCGGYNGQMQWKHRVRWIWRLLRGRGPFGDQIILDAATAKRLSGLLA